MNKIPETQLEATQLKRLAAQRQLASDAKWILGIQVGISGVSPLILPPVVANFPGFAVWAACFGAIITILVILWLTPWRNSLKEKSAKIQELFDCDVLVLEWREIAIGSRLETIETVEKYAPKDRSENFDNEEFGAWYRIEIGKVPIHFGRLICQRTNCRWSSELRHCYAVWIRAFLSVLAIAIIVVILVIQQDLEVKEFILGVVIPLMPAFVLGMQQQRAHTNSVALLDNLVAHAEDLWKDALEGPKTKDALEGAKTVASITGASRELQDAIYNDRRTGPLIPTWLYKLKKKKMDEQMKAIANEMVEEALKSMD